MSSETPDWNVAIMDGQPEVVVNLAGAADLAVKLGVMSEAVAEALAATNEEVAA